MATTATETVSHRGSLPGTGLSDPVRGLGAVDLGIHVIIVLVTSDETAWNTPWRTEARSPFTDYRGLDG